MSSERSRLPPKVGNLSVAKTPHSVAELWGASVPSDPRRREVNYCQAVSYWQSSSDFGGRTSNLEGKQYPLVFQLLEVRRHKFI